MTMGTNTNEDEEEVEGNYHTSPLSFISLTCN